MDHLAFFQTKFEPTHVFIISPVKILSYVPIQSSPIWLAVYVPPSAWLNR